jgi:hypothetical protein
MMTIADGIVSWGLQEWTLIFLHLVEEYRDSEILLLPFRFLKHLVERLQGLCCHTCNLNATFLNSIIIHYFFI